MNIKSSEEFRQHVGKMIGLDKWPYEITHEEAEYQIDSYINNMTNVELIELLFVLELFGE